MRSNGRAFKRIYAIGRRLSRFGWSHVSGAPEDDGGAGDWESRISRSSRSKLKLLLRPYKKVSDQLGISGSCTAVGYQPLAVRLHTASLRADWSWAIAVPAIQSVTPLLPD